MALSSISFLKSRAFFLWALVAASILQLVGFTAGAVHAQDTANHLAFLAGFATITTAPVFLSIANYTIFGHLVGGLTLFNGSIGQQRSLSLRLCACGLIAAHSVVILPLAAMGIYHIASFLSPIIHANHQEALARLVRYETGVRILSIANAIHLFSASIFGIVSVAGLYHSPSWTHHPWIGQDRRCKDLLHTIIAVNATLAFRAVVRLYEYSRILESEWELGQGGLMFWVGDAAPMLCALALFCAVKPISCLTAMPILSDTETPLASDMKTLYGEHKQATT